VIRFFGGVGLGSYRGRLDIIADILAVARQRAKKTQIMYGANLSYRLLTRYLAEIKRAYLVRFEREEGCYVLTRKGMEFLERYKEYSKRNKHVEKQINDVDGKRKVLEGLCS
jgi:predicted transcriptional regulator